MREHLDPQFRFRHLYIAGLSGYGKSTLIQALALQDIQAGEGVCVLDPKGDLASTLLEWVPSSRIKDVVYLDETTHVPLKLLQWESPEEKRRVMDDVFNIIRRLCENDAGQRWPFILQRAIQAVVTTRRAFTDINEIIDDERVRAEIVTDLIRLNAHQKLITFWTNFPKPYPFDAGLPITTRLSKITDDDVLSLILGNRDAKLSIGDDIVEKRKVLIVNLAAFTSQQQQVLGSVIISQIQQAAFRRMRIGEPHRIPFFLYCDEFQDFKTSTEAAAEMLRKARGFKISLTLANQFPTQIEDLLHDVKGCVSSYVMFKMDPDEARPLKHKLLPYELEALDSLKEFQAIYRPPNGASKLITTPKYPTAEENKRRPNHGPLIRLSTLQTFHVPPRQTPPPDAKLKHDVPRPQPPPNPPRRVPRRGPAPR